MPRCSLLCAPTALVTLIFAGFLSLPGQAQRAGRPRVTKAASTTTVPAFSAPTVATTGARSLGSMTAVTADFNGDGIPDVATANLADSSISILFGSGNGSFRAAVNYQVGTGPYALVVGDFNGDGFPDLATSNNGDETVSILLNNGKGVFPATPSATYGVGSGPYGILIGDPNNDGRADLVVTNNVSKTVSVLLGNGDGTFQTALSYSVGNYPLGTAVGDFNGDGYADLAVWNVAGNTVSVLINDTKGSFFQQVTYATGVDPYGVTVGDFNGDGFVDLAVANVGANTVSILLNDGTGKFLAQTAFATGGEPTSVLAQDLNADGVLDLAVTNYSDGTVGVLLGRGDGTFLPQTALAVGRQPFAVIAGDLNGDQKTDLIVTNSVTNTVAMLQQAKPALIDETTYHFDNARTGINPYETTLTLANVKSSTFGKLNVLATTGKVDAEPLYLSSVSIGGQTRNVVYVASEDDSMYAFDADAGTLLWKTSALGTGEVTSDPHNCDQISPQIGITGTPVIDRNMGAHGMIYFVAMSKDTAGAYHQRLHALDITTGQESTGSPTEITGSYAGTGDNSKNGNVVFDPYQYAERIGLLLTNQTLYLGWTSHCDERPYTGWVMGYNESTLQQSQILNLTPNGNEGAVWMAGAGMAADTGGNIFLLDANGVLDGSFNANGFPTMGDYGNAILKLSASSGKLAVADFFEPYNTDAESNADIDLGSGGALLLPDQVDGAGIVHHLVVGAGKDRNIYVGNRDHLGKYNVTDNSQLYQELTGALPNGAWSMPAYYNGTVYYGGVADRLRAFPVRSAKLSASPSSISATSFGYPGATPTISANGNTNGIVWALESGTGSAGVLHAYDATNLATELYNSTQAAGSRDAFGNGNKFITPVVIAGKVYVPTPTGVAVFGLLAP